LLCNHDEKEMEIKANHTTPAKVALLGILAGGVLGATAATAGAG